MNAQLELKYPEAPGYKKSGTSKEAAQSMRSRAATLRELAYKALCRAALTADEVAERLNESALAIRPRLSELARQGLIVETGARRLNASGKSAAVWRAA